FVIKQVVLITRYPGASPTQVERLITEPIEREVQSMAGVYKIRSDSYRELSRITVELDPATPANEIQQKWDELRRKTLNIQSQLPSGASTINVGDDFGDLYGIYYGLTAQEGFTYEDLRYWAQFLKRELTTIEGVQKVGLYGEQTQVVNLFINLERLANLRISPEVLISTIGSQNQLIGSGSRTSDGMNLSIVGSSTYQRLSDILSQVLVVGDQRITIGDIARVEYGYLDPTTSLMEVDGVRAIGVGISTLSGYDVVQTGERVRQRVKELQPQIPVGIDLVPLYLEDEIAAQANSGFVLNLVESVGIVIVVILLFMGWRAGVLIGSSLIFSIGGTLLIMYFIGAGLNRTSLAGFIIAMGMLVDNAIVVSDNARILIARGTDRRGALIQGATTPQWGLLGATFIGVASFLPLYLAPSAVAEIVKPLFTVLAISLSLSWVLALTQTPLFGNFILRQSNPANIDRDPYASRFYKAFEWLLRRLIAHRWLTLTGMAVLLIGSIVLMGRAPESFFPNLDKPYFRADCFLPDGYNIEESHQQISQLCNYLKRQPSVKRVSMTVGGSPLRYYLASTSFAARANAGNILIELTTEDSTASLERRFAIYAKENFPDMIVRSSLFKLSPAVEATIEMGYIGENIDTLVMLSQRAKEIMRGCPLVGDIRSDWGNLVPTIDPKYSQAQGQILGITAHQVAQYIKLSTTGLTLGEFRKGDLFMPILLKDSRINNFNLANIGSTPIFDNLGEVVPLDQVVDSIAIEYQYSQIKRYNRQRVIRAQCDPLLGANAKEAYYQVYKAVSEGITPPQGYQFKVFGEQESEEESNEALAQNMPLTLVIIITTLLLLFGSYRKPIIILMMIPLILIGVVMGLAITSNTLDFFALLGVLGLVGMNIKNAVVLVDQIALEGEGLEAVIRATKSRVIPVALASGTTILGMIPLLPDALFASMAATIMGGLLVASLLTILVLPVTYTLIMRIPNR
ncbi:MAG: efflux RND transporter permease subunit, partial [Rikenellaceae bacterium]